MEVKIPEPKYKVETVTLEEIDKRDEHNRLKAGLLYGSRSAYRLHSRNIRAGNVHMNGVSAAPTPHWPANSATRW